MKKFFKTSVITLLLASISMGTIGCSSGTKDTGNRTVLDVGVTNGGLGYHWAELIAEKFEEKYANVSFEEGKTGVYVDINPQKNEFSIDSIQAAIANEQGAEDIYFTFHDVGLKFAKLGYAKNINDLVYEKAYTADGEVAEWNSETKSYVNATMSVYDKLFPIHQESHNFSDDKLDGVLSGEKDGIADDLNGDGIANDAGFYALPFEDELSGFIYDYDLFKEKGWLDYDGIDGLPDNEEDFFDLFDRIVDAGMIPYTTGDVTWYMQEGFQDAFFAQYEGYDNAALNYTYNGEYVFAKSDLPADVVDSIKNEDYFEDTSEGYKVQITAENAWLLVYQPSKVAYANFVRRLTDTDYYDMANFHKTTYSYTDAQQTFVMSKLGKQNQKRIAMIQEGEWWENEARVFFDYTGGYGSREFRFFPLPQINGQKDASVRSLGNYSRGTDLFINAKTKKYDLAKLFVQFAHSESSLETFTMETGITRFYKYDLNDEQLAKMTPFGRNVYKIKMTDTSGVTVFTAKDKTEADPFYNSSKMTMGGMGTWIRVLEPGSSTKLITEDTFTAFINRSGAPGTIRLSAEDYIDGMRRYYTKTAWENAYRAFIG